METNPECDASFAEVSEIRESNMISEKQKASKCPSCDSMLIGADVLANHFKNHHSNETDARCICKICDKKYMNVDLQIYHDIVDHWRGPLDFLQRWPIFKPAKSLRKYKTGKKFRCQNCDQDDFPNVQALKAHAKNFHLEGSDNKQKHQCEICQKQYMIPKALDKHVKLIHGKRPESEKIFDCMICVSKYSVKTQYHFHNQRTLHSHWERIHPDVAFDTVFRGYTCNKCGHKSWLAKEDQEHSMLNLCGLSYAEQAVITDEHRAYQRHQKHERKAELSKAKDNMRINMIRQTANIARKEENGLLVLVDEPIDKVGKFDTSENCLYREDFEESISPDQFKIEPDDLSDPLNIASFDQEIEVKEELISES